MNNQNLLNAKKAFESGEYSRCISILNLIKQTDSLSKAESAEISLIMANAYIGKGENDKAISICKSLTDCKNDAAQKHAKQLLCVLEAPILSKPKVLNSEIPKLEINQLTNKKGASTIKTNSDKNLYQKQPTGKTNALSLRFSSIVLAILLIITFLLSGCVNFNSQLQIVGPDLLDLNWRIQSNSYQRLTWQNEFENSFKLLEPQIIIHSSSKGLQTFKSIPVNSSVANKIFKNLFIAISQSSGLELSIPEISLIEKNWIIGLKQNLLIKIDLTKLPSIPGAKFTITFSPSSNNSVIISKPLLIEKQDDLISWVLKEGSYNELSINEWRWNPIGLGTIFIIIIMSLSFLLQRIKLTIGYGFPQLPP